MTSLASILEVLERIDNASIAVHQGRCALVRNRNSGCRRCAEACTSGCISFTDDGLEVDASLCVGCGTCTTVCPTGALEARSPSDDDLLGSCANALKKLGDEAVIVCSTMAQRASSLIDPQRCAVVPCLGRVDESLLCTIACAGAERIALVHGPCAECALRPGEAVAHEVAATTRELLSAWSIPTAIEIADLIPRGCRRLEADYDSDRRALFGDLASHIGSAARTVVSDERKPQARAEALRFQKVTEDGTLPHFLPERRRHLLSVLAGRGAPDDVMVATRLWGHVIIDADKCSSCRMCATFCPTGAIAKYDREDGLGVEHAPSACVKCRVCENICPEGALSLSDEVFAVDLMEGVVEHYPMKPRPSAKNQEESMRNTMREVLGSDRIY